MGWMHCITNHGENDVNQQIKNPEKNERKLCNTQFINERTMAKTKEIKNNATKTPLKYTQKLLKFGFDEQFFHRYFLSIIGLLLSK